MKLDPAIVTALDLPPKTTFAYSSHGGSGFASTSRIKATFPGDDEGGDRTQSFFLKTSAAEDADTMFRGEHASLNAINGVVPTLCPRSLGWGQLREKGGHFLVTEFLDLGSRTRSGGATGAGKGSRMSLAEKLAKLHTTPARMPEGMEKPMFGFPTPTCCGDTVQPNNWKESWADFYGEERLTMILRTAERRNGKDAGLRALTEKVVGDVVPRLLGDGHLGGKEGIRPVVVHGDLWSGNKGRGIIDRMVEDGGGAVEDVVFDPSACYAHSEFELGIMQMFGGFGGRFLEEYHKICPKTEPKEEYADRVALYELYHHLNHYAIFGGGYKGGAVSIMKDLVKKYG